MKLVVQKLIVGIVAVLLIAVVISFQHFMPAISILVITFMLLGFSVAISVVYKKHRKAYLEGKLTRTNFVRNVSLEILGILLAMILAGLTGKYLAQVVTVQITHDFTKLIASIMIGLFAGIVIGFLVKKTWGRLV